MQVFGLPRHVTRGALERWRRARSNGLGAADAADAVGEARADFPMWGKARIAVLLRRQGYAASESTVGRILKKLVGQSAVTPVSRPYRSMAAPSSRPTSNANATNAASTSSNCPGSPELNGCVERNNGAWRYEFYATWDLDTDDLDDVNRWIDAFADEFNTFRPHNALDGQTPAEYLLSPTAKETQPSHMS